MKTPALTKLTLFLAFITLVAQVVAATAPSTPSFTADRVITLQGTLEAANRYKQADFNRFDAGNGFVRSQDADGFNQGANATLKGIAVFDLNADNMRDLISDLGQQRLILSFSVLQIKGKPRPLRVEYVGCFDDLVQADSLSKVFQASPIVTVNNVMRRSSKVGLKLADITDMASKSMKGRWLVIRFEQEGLRIENTGESDLYQMRPDPMTVRLSISDKDVAGQTVAGHYHASGYGSVITDMPENLLGDMPTDPIQDMPKNPIQDMPKNPIQDMPENPIQDLPENSIQD